MTALTQALMKLKKSIFPDTKQQGVELKHIDSFANEVASVASPVLSQSSASTISAGSPALRAKVDELESDEKIRAAYPWAVKAYSVEFIQQEDRKTDDGYVQRTETAASYVLSPFGSPALTDSPGPHDDFELHPSGASELSPVRVLEPLSAKKRTERMEILKTIKKSGSVVIQSEETATILAEASQRLWQISNSKTSDEFVHECQKAHDRGIFEFIKDGIKVPYETLNNAMRWALSHNNNTFHGKLGPQLILALHRRG